MVKKKFWWHGLWWVGLSPELLNWALPLDSLGGPRHSLRLRLLTVPAVNFGKLKLARTVSDLCLLKLPTLFFSSFFFFFFLFFSQFCVVIKSSFIDFWLYSSVFVQFASQRRCSVRGFVGKDLVHTNQSSPKCLKKCIS